MKVLLASVFGPFGVDDDYGRKENVLELFHNQITREQGVFSIRTFNPSFGLHLIAENIECPARVLDFPTVERFVEEIRKNYDYIGLSFIVPNYKKVKKMAELVREHAPRSKIVLGGHGVQASQVQTTIPHDHLCIGEGIVCFRRLLGEEPAKRICHPIMRASYGSRVLGMPVGTVAALCPGVGCPKGCYFCSTSHFFDKRHSQFLATGEDLFEVCRNTERHLRLREFIVFDENFLLQKARAESLLCLMKKNKAPYSFSVFASADTIQRLGADFLAELGISTIWVGFESKMVMFQKNIGIDFMSMVKELRDHGISVIVSGILFLQEHDKESLWDDVCFLVDLAPDFVQFMQLGPAPGTPLYETLLADGRLRTDIPYEEWHGQGRIWFDHPQFTPEETEELLRRAFQHDYDTHGASLIRCIDTAIRGYVNLSRKYTDDEFMDLRIKDLERRIALQRCYLAAAIDHAHSARARKITEDVNAECDRLFGPLTGQQEKTAAMFRRAADREVERVQRGENVYQPPTLVTDYRGRQ